MILTCHLLVGAAIASKMSNPLLTLPLAFLSHYFLDLPPQHEYSILNIKEKLWNKSFFDFLKVFLDISLGITLISIFSRGNPIIFVGAFLAIVPDGVTLINIVFPDKKPLVLHQKMHAAINDVCDSKNKKIPPFWGILSQIVVVMVAIFLL